MDHYNSFFPNKIWTQRQCLRYQELWHGDRSGFPLISIVVPTYNRGFYLKRCLRSLLHQTYPFLELIVVDDGSTDDTQQLLPILVQQLKQEFVNQGPWRKRLEKDTFPSVILTSMKQSGVSQARNHGVKLARGEWIAFCDSDDEWLPQKLDEQWSLLKESSTLWCHGEEIWIRDGRRVNAMKKHQKRGGWIFADCLERCVVSPSTVVIQRDLFEQVGGFQESFPVCEDYDLWLKIARDFPVSFVPEPIVIKYGGHRDQLSRDSRFIFDEWRVEALMYQWKNYKDSDLPRQQEEKQKLREEIVNKTRIILEGYQKKKDTQFLHFSRDEILYFQQLYDECVIL
jgi:glycosyltransferase involved in cell wall biosynthesis